MGEFLDLLNYSKMTSSEQYSQPFIEIEILDSDITTNEISLVLKKAKIKGPGFDRISKNVPESSIDKLCLLLNIFNTADITDSFKHSIIYHLFKTG